jgi:hypothetical protein
MTAAKPKRPKLLEHKIFATTIWPTETPGVVELEVARGATRRTFEKDGAFVGEQQESTATLWVNIGDRIVVFGAGTADNTACAEVLAVTQSGYRERLRVRVVAGEFAGGTATSRRSRSAATKPRAGTRRISSSVFSSPSTASTARAAKRT